MHAPAPFEISIRPASRLGFCHHCGTPLQSWQNTCKPCGDLHAVAPATIEQLRDAARRAFVAPSPFNINSLDEDCPFGRERPDDDGDDARVNSATFGNASGGA